MKYLLKTKPEASYVVSLRKETIELLESDETWRKDVLYRTNGKPKGKPRPSKYIRAVIEEYAQKPNLERQKIYFRDVIKQLSDSIDNKSIIAFKRNDHINKLIPIKIDCDKHEMHLYLAGISIYTDKDDEKEKLGTTVSHRIDRINGKITTLPLTTVPAIKNDIDIKRQQVYDDIRDKGIEFLVSDIDEIKVRLTKRGKKNYNQWLFQRPKYSKKEGDDIYVFNISKYQITVYFFKFGEDAEIIEPPDLREEFAKKYSNAAKIYQKNRPFKIV